MQISSLAGWQCPFCLGGGGGCWQNSSNNTSGQWALFLFETSWQLLANELPYSTMPIMSFIPVSWSKSRPFQLSTLSTNEVSDLFQLMSFVPFLRSESWPADSFRPSGFQLSRPMSFLISPNQWALFLFLGLRVGRLTASDRPAFNPRDQWASSPPSRLCRHWRSRPNPSSSGQLSALLI